TKGHKGKRQDHHVFLSAFALEQFKRLHKETSDTPFCFPSKDGKNHVDTKTVSKLIGDRQCQFKNRSKPLAGPDVGGCSAVRGTWRGLRGWNRSSD
ncbi:hypothetical protein AAIH10_35120, partial [Pseudomonas aeruginosa]